MAQMLTDPGFLFIGTAESLYQLTDAFQAKDIGRSTVFRKIPKAAPLQNYPRMVRSRRVRR